jgi:hypothetical protein
MIEEVFDFSKLFEKVIYSDEEIKSFNKITLIENKANIINNEQIFNVDTPLKLLKLNTSENFKFKDLFPKEKNKDKQNEIVEENENENNKIDSKNDEINKTVILIN